MKILTFKEFLEQSQEQNEAWMSQEHKKKLEPNIKKVLSKYGMKGTISVRNRSTLVVKLTQGKIDFNQDYAPRAQDRARETEMDWHEGGRGPNVYHIESSWKGKAKEFLLELIQQMKGEDYYDDSDQMTDYFHTSHYFDVKFGDYNKPYLVK